MIDIYYAATPNGMKPLLFAAEHGLEARYHFVSLRDKEQFDPAFLKISPNNKIPALVDGDLALFESGVILEYQRTASGLSRGSGALFDPQMALLAGWRSRADGGQNHFFREFAPETIPFAIERYTEECKRLYGVLDAHLAEAEFVGGAGYHIADMAIYPWIWYHEMHHVPINDYPHVKRWFDALSARASVAATYERFMPS